MTATPTLNTGVPTATGVFTRASSGLVRQVRTDDVMFYGWQQIALGYIIFMVAAWQFYPGASMERVCTRARCTRSVAKRTTAERFRATRPDSAGVR